MFPVLKKKICFNKANKIYRFPKNLLKNKMIQMIKKNQKKDLHPVLYLYI